MTTSEKVAAVFMIPALVGFWLALEIEDEDPVAVGIPSTEVSLVAGAVVTLAATLGMLMPVFDGNACARGTRTVTEPVLVVFSSSRFIVANLDAVVVAATSKFLFMNVFEPTTQFCVNMNCSR